MRGQLHCRRVLHRRLSAPQGLRPPRRPPASCRAKVPLSQLDTGISLGAPSRAAAIARRATVPGAETAGPAPADALQDAGPCPTGGATTALGKEVPVVAAGGGSAPQQPSDSADWGLVLETPLAPLHAGAPPLASVSAARTVGRARPASGGGVARPEGSAACTATKLRRPLLQIPQPASSAKRGRASPAAD